MAETRECVVTDINGYETIGHFHRWGESYFVDESNRVVPLTVAIYEDADGNVDTVQPRAIRFTGPRNALEAIQRATGTLGSDL